MKRGLSGINCLLAVDKPLGMSSHDVVNKVRRALGERRVGHAGTLDPAASGVLVVGVGQGTRLMGNLTLDTKSYLAQVEFGFETSTDDAEGEPVARAEVSDELHDLGYARRVVSGLVGEHDQIPPAYSAISVDGKRAYARARSGEEVVLPSRHVSVLEADCLSCGGDPLVWTCAFTVSKGTYIRSIARDLGRQLGTAAHLRGLRRTASGSIGIGCCLTLEQVAELGPGRIVTRALDPLACLGIVSQELGKRTLADAMCGKPIPNRSGAAEGERVGLVSDGKLMGIWHVVGSSLRCDANFPSGVSGVVL